MQVEQLLQLIQALQTPTTSDSVWEIGKPYLIRTVTMIQTGILAKVTEHELVLRDACWIANTGRFHDALKDPSVIQEAEPFVNDCIVGRGSIVDATIWHAVKLEQC